MLNESIDICMLLLLLPLVSGRNWPQGKRRIVDAPPVPIDSNSAKHTGCLLLGDERSQGRNEVPFPMGGTHHRGHGDAVHPALHPLLYPTDHVGKVGTNGAEFLGQGINACGGHRGQELPEPGVDDCRCVSSGCAWFQRGGDDPLRARPADSN